MDFADKLDMMDDDCNIEGFPDENILKEKTMKQNWEKETVEHFVTAIGIMAEEEDDWFSEKSFKDAVEYTKSYLEQAKKEERERILKALPKEDIPKLGSENQDLYVAYSNGFNNTVNT